MRIKKAESYLLTTPLQVVNYISSIANGGKLMKQMWTYPEYIETKLSRLIIEVGAVAEVFN